MSFVQKSFYQNNVGISMSNIKKWNLQKLWGITMKDLIKLSLRPYSTTFFLMQMFKDFYNLIFLHFLLLIVYNIILKD